MDELVKSAACLTWKKEKIRDTVKGVLYLDVCKIEVWLWDEASTQAKKKVLIITKTKEAKPKVRYSISNGSLEQYTHQEYGYFVSQRYWVERCFDDAKNELGLSHYQVRKWQSWHTHHAIVMMVSLFILTQQTENQQEMPLLSFRDARVIIVSNICLNDIQLEKKVKQMIKRQRKREKDIKCL